MENQHSEDQMSSSSNIKVSSVSPREYGCPCGKAYLSYPALFTHVKQKHNGKPPGEIVKPAGKTNLKRGRPRGIKNREGGGRLTATDFTKRLGESNTIDMHFLHFLITVAKDLKEDTACSYAKFSLYYTYLGCNKIEYKVPTINSEFVFTHFLKELGQKIGERNAIINGVVMLLGLFLSFVDGLYETKMDLSGFSKSEKPEDLSCFANAFMTDSYPQMVKVYDLEGVQFFEFKNVSKIIMYVFQWLYQKKYVNQYLLFKSPQNSGQSFKKSQSF